MLNTEDDGLQLINTSSNVSGYKIKKKSVSLLYTYDKWDEKHEPSQ